MRTDISAFPEDDLVDQIECDLKAYFSGLSLAGYTKKTVNQDQAFENLDKFCGDLIAAYEDFGALVLEVKVRTRTKASDFLPAYKQPQHFGLRALRSAGVPIYFSYNDCGKTDFRGADYKFNLQKIIAPEPEELLIETASTGRIKTVAGKTLSDVLRDKKQGTWIHACAALRLVFNPSVAPIVSGINTLSAKILILIYSDSLQKLLLIDQHVAKVLIEKVRAQSIVADCKGGPQFIQAISSVTESIVSKLTELAEPHPEANRLSGEITVGEAQQALDDAEEDLGLTTRAEVDMNRNGIVQTTVQSDSLRPLFHTVVRLIRSGPEIRGACRCDLKLPRPPFLTNDWCCPGLPVQGKHRASPCAARWLERPVLRAANGLPRPLM